MAQSIVSAVINIDKLTATLIIFWLLSINQLVSREIKTAPSYTGFEGGEPGDDDWLLVDCDNIVVHVMLPSNIHTYYIYIYIYICDIKNFTFSKLLLSLSLLIMFSCRLFS